LKPHFGNAPRLSAHLSLIAPEPLKSSMTVGGEQVFWMEGKSIIFDDTYVHYLNHWGTRPRYVMNVWFCHPCDDGEAHNHGQSCPNGTSRAEMKNSFTELAASRTPYTTSFSVGHDAAESHHGNFQEKVEAAAESTRHAQLNISWDGPSVRRKHMPVGHWK